jgi:hypothetical protein
MTSGKFGFHRTTTNGEQFIVLYYGNVKNEAVERAILIVPDGLERSGMTGRTDFSDSTVTDSVVYALSDSLISTLKAN